MAAWPPATSYDTVHIQATLGVAGEKPPHPVGSPEAPKGAAAPFVRNHGAGSVSSKPFAVSSESNELVKVSVAGLCDPMMREQIVKWMEKLEGEQIFVYIRQIGVILTIAELQELVSRENHK